MAHSSPTVTRNSSMSSSSEDIDVDNLPMTGITSSSGPEFYAPPSLGPSSLGPSLVAAAPELFIQKKPVLPVETREQLTKLVTAYKPILQQVLDVEKQTKELKKLRKNLKEQQNVLEKDILAIMNSLRMHKLGIGPEHYLTKVERETKRSLKKEELFSEAEDFISSQLEGYSINLSGIIKAIEEKNKRKGKGKTVTVLRLQKKARTT